MYHKWDLTALDAVTIGLDVNFLQLGDNSIAVTKVVAGVRKAGIELAVIDGFNNPN